MTNLGAMAKGCPTTMAALASVCAHWGVPTTDGILIAMNLFGVTVPNSYRTRLYVTLEDDPGVEYLLIPPATPPTGTPFHIRDGRVLMNSDHVATVQRMEPDDAIGAYFRNGGCAVTLNPQSRSSCTGCLFCPNTLELGSDPPPRQAGDLEALLEGLARSHPQSSLTAVTDVVVSSGCYREELRAVRHLMGIRRALRGFGCDPELGILSSVIRTRDGFELLAEDGPTNLWLTLECFERRELLLKSTKASLDLDNVPRLLETARSMGVGVTFNYIVGLDSLGVMREWFSRLKDLITMFPNVQIFQAHSKLMDGFRAHGADQLEFYFEARAELEQILGDGQLRPVPWRNYRSLWYQSFNQQRIEGLRI